MVMMMMMAMMMICVLTVTTMLTCHVMVTVTVLEDQVMVWAVGSAYLIVHQVCINCCIYLGMIITVSQAAAITHFFVVLIYLTVCENPPC